MLMLLLQTIIYLVRGYEFVSVTPDQLFCENTKSGKSSTVTLSSKNNSNKFIDEVDSLLYSIKDNFVIFDPPYGICFTLGYVFVEGEWYIMLSIAPDDETSQRTPQLKNKHETISVLFYFKLELNSSCLF